MVACGVKRLAAYSALAVIGARGNAGGGEPRTGAGVVLAGAPGPPAGATAAPAARIAFTLAASCAALEPGAGPSGAQGDAGGVTPAGGFGDGAKDESPA